MQVKSPSGLTALELVVMIFGAAVAVGLIFVGYHLVTIANHFIQKYW